jgi:predicted porin
VHHNLDTGTATVAGPKAKTTFLGATYDLRVVKLHAAYATNKTDSAVLATRVDRDEAMLGVSAPVGAAGVVLASWIHRKDDTPTANDADQFAIGYIHNLSKRTNLYTSFAKTKNDPTGRLNNPAVAGGDPSVFNVGVRHRF